jgi:hypothetical protein
VLEAVDLAALAILQVPDTGLFARADLAIGSCSRFTMQHPRLAEFEAGRLAASERTGTRTLEDARLLHDVALLVTLQRTGLRLRQAPAGEAQGGNHGNGNLHGVSSLSICASGVFGTTLQGTTTRQQPIGCHAAACLQPLCWT